MNLPLVSDLPTTLAQSFQLQLQPVLMIVFVIVSVLMILIVLIQRPQGGGLSGAFGASSEGAGQTAFGAKTGDALTLATVTIFVLFLLFAIGLNFSLRPTAAPEGTTIGSTDPAGESDEDGATPEATDDQGNPIEIQRVTPEEAQDALESGEAQPLPGTTTPDETPDTDTPEDDAAGG